MDTRPILDQRVSFIGSEGTVKWVKPNGFALVRTDAGSEFWTPWYDDALRVAEK